MRAALACALLPLFALPARADGPALAHLTLAGTTITLTEVVPIQGGAMTFAQMHLGFPLPPLLRVVLGDEGTVHSISLNGSGDGSNGTGTALGPETFFWVEPQSARVTGDTQSLRIEAEALSRTALGQFTALPLWIEIQLTSP
ncbi:hypothetical protein KUL25_02335 [Rhodobacteraceae bacterium N5(2021)]|uniref:DUF4402 domain-containing protein n=1 Tax=Gymnodinialimonas phycosphaerae TaxID=2841589 RepID=A0A975YGI2_9RHOB|nr:hypothetical protein [Gymnodinialimonas phycosphaerae]MBY4891599.1 hypothetical protein [Gymnodinialimonas phycosphaerae]